MTENCTTCGHSKMVHNPEHLDCVYFSGQTGKLCSCTKYAAPALNSNPTGTTSISTLVDTTNLTSYVEFKVGEVKLVLSPDACADIALKLLAAAYAARSEQAVMHIAKHSNSGLSIDKILKELKG